MWGANCTYHSAIGWVYGDSARPVKIWVVAPNTIEEAFFAASDGIVKLSIYDATGSTVRSIDIGFKVAAVYESKDKAIYWDGRNTFGEQVASGAGMR